MRSSSQFLKLFGRLKSNVVGMIHVKALPGTPGSRHPMHQILKTATDEAQIYLEAGVDGIIVENMHDTPYVLSESMGPEIVAAMSVICSEVRQVCPGLPVGVQILSGANKQAMAVAKAASLDFIRAEGFVFSHIADEGLMNSCAGELLRYRKSIEAEHIQIFTDIKKKHSSHSITSDVDIIETAKAAEYFLSDGVIITGTSTGTVTDTNEVAAVQDGVGIPVLIGSGVTVANVDEYMSASALIIGSHFKHGGRWQSDVDYRRVKDFVKAVKKLRQN